MPALPGNDEPLRLRNGKKIGQHAPIGRGMVNDPTGGADIREFQQGGLLSQQSLQLIPQRAHFIAAEQVQHLQEVLLSRKEIVDRLGDPLSGLLLAAPPAVKLGAVHQDENSRDAR